MPANCCIIRVSESPPEPISMKYAPLAFALCLPLFFNSPAQAQTTTSNDSTAVQATVRNYIEAYYTGDAARMQPTLHPPYLKHMIHSHIPMRERTDPQMLEPIPPH